MKLFERLIELRETRGISKKTLANSIGVSDRMIYYYESGQKRPDIETLSRLADFFGVTMDFLVGRTDDPSPSSPREQDPAK